MKPSCEWAHELTASFPTPRPFLAPVTHVCPLDSHQGRASLCATRPRESRNAN